jgi:MoxR-like ATPase
MLKNEPLESPIVKVKVSPGIFLSQDEQKTLLMLMKRGARRVVLNHKDVEVTQTSGNMDLDEKNTIIVPDLSYDLPQTLTSQVPSDVPTFFDFSNLWQKTLYALQITGQAVLIGEKGVGKDHLCLAIAQEYRLPVFDISSSRNLTEYDLIGHYELVEGKTQWIEGLLPIWCRYGGLLILDEISLARSSVLARVHSLFDFRRYLVVKEHQNERISRHPNAFALITLNPPRGAYMGTQNLNIAFLDRFQVIAVPEPSFDDKVNIVKIRSKLGDGAFIEGIVEVSEKINEEYRQGNLHDFVSLRNLIDCCNLIKNGLGKKDAVEIAIVNRFTSEEEVTRVEEICSILIE